MKLFCKVIVLALSSFLYRIFNPFSLRFLNFYRNGRVFFPKISSMPSNSVIIDGDGLLYRGKMNVSGEDNKIVIGGHVFSSNIDVDANGSSLIIGNKCSIRKIQIFIRGKGNSLIIEEGSTFGTNCWIVLMGNNNSIHIGKDCMIADGVDIWASDSHPIFLNSDFKKIVNISGSILLKNHVWLGKKSTILKNVEIGENSVVGIGSIVTKNIPDNSIAVGNPAIIVRSDINWSRQHTSI